MKKLKMTLVVLVAVAVIATVALKLAIPTLSGKSAASGIVVSSDGLSSLGDCPDTPNCHGSESSRQAQTVARFVITKTASDAIDTLATIVSTQARTQIVTQDERYLHATFATKFMGYIDDVEFLLADDGQSVQVRSASRIGKSDLGANKKRINNLRTLAEGKL
ncbi:MAG: DUF1499 domain-containing protein [Granulosicoccus sp.]